MKLAGLHHDLTSINTLNRSFLAAVEIISHLRQLKKEEKKTPERSSIKIFAKIFSFVISVQVCLDRGTHVMPVLSSRRA